MRIIAGTARGIRLLALDDLDIRPTLDRVRESLFNIIAGDVPGARFLDLFAGTGANGLEALSRGAAEVTFVDASAGALTLVRNNLRKTRLEGAVTSIQLQLPKDLGRIPGSFDLVFADPPYQFDGHSALLAGINAGPLLAEEGILVLEHQRRQDVASSVGALTRFRQKRYGDTLLSFYSRLK